jgi:IS4 transposase
MYDKLNKSEPQISAALVYAAYQRMAPIVEEMGARRAPLIAGYRTRIVDGNHLAATEHRLEVLRAVGAGALPGVALVVYDRELGLIRQVYLDEDAYTQERAIVLETLSDVEEGDLWIADRNFCTATVLFQLAADGAAFIIRKHSQNVRFHVTGAERKIGETSTGVVYEQPIGIEDDFGNVMPARRICVRLFEPTRDGETELVLFSNLPASVSALEIAEAYRNRWEIETTFNHMDRMFEGEIKSLGNPRAALLVFCVAAIAFNTVSVVMASLRAEHGEAKVDQEVSPYYIGVYVRSDWNGLHLIWSPEEWTDKFSNLTPEEMAKQLRIFASHVDLDRMPRNPRGPKKPPPKRTSSPDQPHVSTARLLAAAKCKK